MTGAPADAAAQALSTRLFRSMLATQESFTAYLGVKLGLYEALRDRPATAGELAARTGTAPRYVREWLEQQAGAGLLGCDAPALPPDRRVYRLPPGHERVLTASADPMSLVWTAMLPLGGVAGALPSLLAAFRTGEGVPAAVFGEDWRHGHGGANRAVYTERLAGWLRRWLPDVHRALATGGGRIADVGCGAGWAAIALARAYPAASVTAVDLDGPSVAEARTNAAAAGVGGQLRLAVVDAARLPGGDHDLVCLFDMLHEASRPVDVLRAARGLAGAGRPVLVLDALVGDGFDPPGGEVERFQHATSVLHCLPAALVGEDAEGVGTVLRPGTVRELAAAAGFARVRAYDLDDRFHRFYRLDG